MFETISQLPAENIEVRLLRRAVEVLEAASGAPGSTPHLPDRLIGAIEEGHRALRDTIGRLSATVDALGATMQSSVEAVETAMRTTVARLPLIAENSYADAARFSELHAAVEVLTAVLQGLTALPDNGGALLPGPDIVPRRRVVEPQLTRELRKLLQEIEAAS